MNTDSCSDDIASWAVSTVAVDSAGVRLRDQVALVVLLAASFMLAVDFSILNVPRSISPGNGPSLTGTDGRPSAVQELRTAERALTLPAA